MDAPNFSQRYIDAQVERVLRAAGSSLRHYMPSSKDKLRETMKLVLADAIVAARTEPPNDQSRSRADD